jgi:ABC-type dipeptide/oligopeptide/nickel transport system permease component
MLPYLLKRLILLIPMLLGITLVSFIVIHLAPGSPTDMQTMMNPKVLWRPRSGCGSSTAWTSRCTSSTGIGCPAWCAWTWGAPLPRMAGRSGTRSKSGCR